MLLTKVLLLIRILFALIFFVDLVAGLGVWQGPDGGYARCGGAKTNVCNANSVLYYACENDTCERAGSQRHTINLGTEACMMSSRRSIIEPNLSPCISGTVKRQHGKLAYKSGFMMGQTPLKTAFAHSALSFVRSSALTCPSPSSSEPARKPRIRSACQTRSSKSIREMRCIRNSMT